MNISRFQKTRKFGFIVFSVAAASSVGLIGGIGLELIQDKILALVPLLIALPGLNAVIGDYASTVAAHAGDPQDRKAIQKSLVKAMSKSLWLSITSIVILSSLLALQRGYILEVGFLIKYVTFVALAVVISLAFIYSLSYALDKLLENNRLNSDDVLIPIVTSLTDVLMFGMVAMSFVLLF